MTDTKTYTHAEIRALLDAIPPGAWLRVYNGARNGYDIETRGAVEAHVCRLPYDDGMGWRTGDFIAAAPAVVRQLLEEVERLRAELDRLKAEPLIYLTRSDYEAMRFKADKAGALAAAAEEALAAMEMQLARERGAAHIPQSTARHIWDAAAGATSAALKAWRGEN